MKKATLTEIKNHILMLKPGEKLSCYLSYRGNDMMAADLDVWVDKGLLHKEYGNASNYQHVEYFRAY